MASGEGDAEGDAVERRERTRLSAPETSWALRDLNRAAAEVDHALAGRLGLRAVDYAALNHILSATRPLGPYELSARLDISSGSASELVDRLQRSGHVERRRDETDRRRVALHLTDTALARVLAALGPLFDDVDALAGGFDRDEQEVITRYLRAAAVVMRRFAHEPPATQEPPATDPAPDRGG